MILIIKGPPYGGPFIMFFGNRMGGSRTAHTCDRHNKELAALHRAKPLLRTSYLRKELKRM
jgi:hypothetical protein